VHVPYHVTWAHELEHGLAAGDARVLTVDSAAGIPAAIAALDGASA
jgi:putative hydrolase of the HAD superfamily